MPVLTFIVFFASCLQRAGLVVGWQPCCRLQGMNFVAGCLLLFMDEEDAFWCLTTIIEDLLPGYFSTTMVAPQVLIPAPHLCRPRSSHPAMDCRLVPIAAASGG